MTRKLFIISTLAFWIVIIGLGLASLWREPAEPGAAPAEESAISPAELAQHATPDNCWMAIRGAVYDLSGYLPEHPSRPDIVLPWCGREATAAYDTKMKGRPHSAYADELLANYRLGPLDQAP